MAVTVTRTDPLAAPVNVAATTGTASGDLTPGKTYHYRVIAAGAGNFPEFGHASAEVSATPDANGSVDVSWDPVSGASGYMVFRTPASGDYSFVHPGSTVNMDHDQHCMYLKNGELWFRRGVTVTGNELTDLGTATERPSGLSYYRSWVNFRFPEKPMSSIVVSGGTESSPATLDDIYAEDQAQGWGAFVRLFGVDGGFRGYDCFDNLEIRDHFADRGFVLRLHGDLRANDNDGGARRFGMLTDDGAVALPAVFIIRGANRNYSNAFSMRNCSLYGFSIATDAMEATPGLAEDPNHYSNSNGSVFYQDVTLERGLINARWQNVRVYDDSVSMSRVDIHSAIRGLGLYASPALEDVGLHTVYYEVFVSVGGSTQSMNGAAMGKGPGDVVYRFYGGTVQDSVVRLVDPVFPVGHGLPDSASQSGGAYDNAVEVLYTVNLRLLDGGGGPVDGASVTLTDGEGSVTNLSTGPDGKITEQELPALKATRSTQDDGTFDTLTDYSAYSLEIEGGGYEYNGEFTLDGPLDMTITLSEYPGEADVRKGIGYAHGKYTGGLVPYALPLEVADISASYEIVDISSEYEAVEI